MIALATSDDESTSPTPTRPASVWTLTTRVSWLPSQRSLTSGRRRWMASTFVIFMAGWWVEVVLRPIDRLRAFGETSHPRTLPEWIVASVGTGGSSQRPADYAITRSRQSDEPA